MALLSRILYYGRENRKLTENLKKKKKKVARHNTMKIKLRVSCSKCRSIHTRSTFAFLLCLVNLNEDSLKHQICKRGLGSSLMKSEARLDCLIPHPRDVTAQRTGTTFHIVRPGSHPSGFLALRHTGLKVVTAAA